VSASIEEQLRRAILTIRSLKQEVETLRSERQSAIAVVGLGCRFPGGGDTPTDFWRLLLSGSDAIVDVPPGRWEKDAWYDADPDRPGRMNTRWGGFLDDVERFDADFFEISAREAESMDPQQRLALEVAWLALEDANLSPDRLRDSSTGVYLGINSAEYYQMALAEPDAFDVHTLSGGVTSVAAGRLAYFLGLNGPALAVDTACSSSLAAVHLALQALRAGECGTALAGGVYTVLRPELSVGLSRLRMMAADGRCKTFDAKADGFVQGEGCALVVLRRLDDALAAGDHIRAVIRGSAINQDGRSGSLTAPSRAAQVQVIRAALRDAGVEADRLDFVETHGTGTALGDPIELHALADALGRTRQRPLVLGAVKTQIGHLGPAAGIAGLVKTVLALEHGMIPPNLHFHRLNPNIDLGRFPAVFPRSPMPWPEGNGPRLAGVSSFGFSGTNVHLVVEQAPRATPAPTSDDRQPDGFCLLCLSARSRQALQDLCKRYQSALTDTVDFPAICRSAATTRRHFEYRLAVVSRSACQAGKLLDQRDPVRVAVRPRLALLIPGDTDWVAGMPPLAEFRGRYLDLDDLLKDPSALPSLAAGVPDSGIAEIAPWLVLRQILQWGMTPVAAVGFAHADLPPMLDKEMQRLGCTVLLQCDSAAGLLLLAPGQAKPLCSVSGKHPEDAHLMAAALYCHGLNPDWRSLFGSGPPAALPHYPFQRRAYWRGDVGSAPPLPSGAPRDSSGRSWPPGAAVVAPTQETVFRLAVGLEPFPWLSDHRVQGEALVPGAFQIACLTAAWQAVSGEMQCTIDGLVFANPLWLPESQTIDVWTSLTADGRARLLSREGSQWREHADGQLASFSPVAEQPVDLALLRRRCRDPLMPEEWRRQLDAVGIHIGSAFQGILRLWRGSAEALAEVALPSGLKTPRTLFHPALFDACLQTAGAALGDLEQGSALLPVGIEHLLFAAPLEGTLWVHARRTRADAVISTDLDVRNAHGKLLVRVQGLHVKRVDRRLPRMTANPEWFYQIAWLPTPSLPLAEDSSPALRLLLAPDKALGQILISQLQGRWGLVTPGASMAVVDERHWQAPVEAMGELVSALGNVTDVLDLHPWAEVSEAGESGLKRALALAQCLVKAGIRPRVWLFTREASGKTESLWQAAIWGLAATLALEHPEYQWRCVDVEGIEDILGELSLGAAGAGSAPVAWRRGRRCCARWIRTPARSVTPLQLDDTVLITGAFGGIGRAVAQWAARRGAKQLVLVGRHAASPAATAFAKSLPVATRTVALDISREDDVRRLFAALGDLPPLRGVFHLAGVQTPGLLADTQWPDIQRALAAKATGAWWLHQATRDCDSLRYFVLFSSVASSLGAAGQGGYSVANAMLDALARYRRGLALPATAIAWGRWAGDGMADALDAAAVRRVEALGLAAMPVDLALAACDSALGDTAPNPCVAAIDWRRFGQRHPSGRVPALVADLVELPAAADAPTVAPPGNDLDAVVVAETRRVLGLDPDLSLDRERPLIELGLDSLLAVELRNRLRAALGRAPSIADLLGGGSLAELVVGLAEPGVTSERSAADAEWEEWVL
jgi:acyl transferase domain-containing protein/NAD(P)-dependent dehydrogenase (short-subunit alcohol dehydrogenase family)/aryl carrier-like protein